MNGCKFGSSCHHRKLYDKNGVLAMLEGFSLLSSGGGGSYEAGRAITEKVLIEIDRLYPSLLEIHDVQCVNDEDLFVVGSMVGAPSAFMVGSSIDYIVKSMSIAVKSIEEDQGRKVVGIFSPETSTINSALMLLVNLRTKRMIVDVDGAGRAVPGLKTLTYPWDYRDERSECTGVPSANTVLCSVPPFYLGSRGREHPWRTPLCISLNANSAQESENEIRRVMSKSGQFANGLAGLAMWPQTGAHLTASHAIGGVFSDAHYLGIQVVDAREDAKRLVNYLDATGRLVSWNEGTIIDITTESRGAYDIDILEFKSNSDRTYLVESLNENLLLKEKDGKVIATAPTVISFLVETKDGYFVMGNTDRLYRFVGCKLLVLNLAVVEIFAESDKDSVGDSVQIAYKSLLNDCLSYTGDLIPNERGRICELNSDGSVTV